MGQRGGRRWSPGSLSILACGGRMSMQPRRPATQSEATLKRTQFDVAVAAADAYLTLAAAAGNRARRAGGSGSRRKSLLRTIQALVNAELRPGADASRAEAELAAARTQLIQAEQATEVARATVAQFVGLRAGPDRHLRAADCCNCRPSRTSGRWIPPRIPLRAEQNAVVEQAQAQLRALERSYFPRFYLQGAAYARGTGAETDGRLLGGLNGLAPNVQDYALGFTVTFPVAGPAGDSARGGRAIGRACARRQPGRSRSPPICARSGTWPSPRCKGARRIAANTPVQVAAARAAAAAGHGPLPIRARQHR